MLTAHAAGATPARRSMRPAGARASAGTAEGRVRPLQRRRARGFTLVEMLVTLAVAIIMVAWAAPSFLVSIQNNRITTDTNGLIADISLMRSEAVKRATAVTLCSTTDGATCTGGQWASGRLLFADPNGDGAFTAGEDVLIRVREPMAGTDVITLTGFNNATFLQVTSAGMLPGAAGSLKICDTKRTGTYGNSVDIIATGRPHLTKSVACP